MLESGEWEREIKHYTEAEGCERDERRRREKVILLYSWCQNRADSSRLFIACCYCVASVLEHIYLGNWRIERKKNEKSSFSRFIGDTWRHCGGVDEVTTWPHFGDSSKAYIYRQAVGWAENENKLCVDFDDVMTLKLFFLRVLTLSWKISQLFLLTSSS